MTNTLAKTKDTFTAAITFQYLVDRLEDDPDDLNEIAELESIDLDEYIVEALNDYFVHSDYKDLRVAVLPKFS